MQVAWDRYHNKRQEQQYITLMNMTGGFILLATGYLLATLVHAITILKVTIISCIVRRFIRAALEKLHVGQVHV